MDQTKGTRYSEKLQMLGKLRPVLTPAPKSLFRTHSRYLVNLGREPKNLKALQNIK